MKRKEFSKKIIVVLFILFVAVLAAGIILAWNGRDTSLFCYAIPSVGGVTGSAVIFYYRKAQVENAIKVQIYSLDQMYRLREKYEDQKSDIDGVIQSQEYDLKSTVNTYKSEGTEPVRIQG